MCDRRPVIKTNICFSYMPGNSMLYAIRRIISRMRFHPILDFEITYNYREYSDFSIKNAIHSCSRYSSGNKIEQVITVSKIRCKIRYNSQRNQKIYSASQSHANRYLSSYLAIRPDTPKRIKLLQDYERADDSLEFRL